MPTQDVWDKRFMGMAKEVSTWSKCLSRHIGAVLVKDNHMIASGYNGTACDVIHCEYRNNDGNYMWNWNKVGNTTPNYICPRQRMGFVSGEGIQWCPAVHAEVNTILQCAKQGISSNRAILYCYCNIPCPNCSKEIINAGIIRVVCLEDKEYHEDGEGLSSKLMFEQAGVKLDFLPEF
jgi:dCMP deaminase